jgi:hypothetical protein
MRGWSSAVTVSSPGTDVAVLSDDAAPHSAGRDWLRTAAARRRSAPAVAPLGGPGALLARWRRRCEELPAPGAEGHAPRRLAGVLSLSAQAAELAARGACRITLLRTRVRPLFVPFAPGRERAQTCSRESPSSRATAENRVHERCRRPDSPAMRDPIRSSCSCGLGLLSFSRTHTARVAAGFFVNTSASVGLKGSIVRADHGAEAFNISAGGSRPAAAARKPEEPAGRIALVTGAAGASAGRPSADCCRGVRSS